MITIAPIGAIRATLPLVVGLLVLSVDDLRAQHELNPPATEFSSAFVDAGHWSIAEARRLAAAGLAPAGFDAGRRVYTQREIALLLEHAQRESDAAGKRRAQAMVASLTVRFAEEFASGGEADRFRGSSIEGSYGRHQGDAATGWGYWYGYPNGVDVVPPEPRPEGRGLAADPHLQWAPFDDLAIRVSSSNPPGEADPRIDESHLVGEWSVLRLWAGRHAIGYGPGESGGITLSDGALFDGFGIQNRRPLRLPWILSHLGPVGFDLTFSRFDLPHSFRDVGFFATRGSISPHDRLQLGVTRAAMFGGDGNTEVDAFAVFSMLIGKHAGDVSELDNQVASVDLAYRPPLERWLPLRLYLEWGFEDSAGAWLNVPGVVAGIQVPLVPGVPALGAGIEYTRVEDSCCGNPIWYRHSTFHDGWTRDGEPLGHPLGGHGRQWSVYGSVSLWDARVRARTLLFRRERMLESLYTPDRLGESYGLDLGVEWRATPWLELSAVQRLENAQEWTESSFRLGLRALL